jgi:hypothetical protein
MESLDESHGPGWTPSDGIRSERPVFDSSVTQRYEGKTVKERLLEACLDDQFEAAVQSRNRARLIEVLGRVELADQAETLAELVLSGLRVSPSLRLGG